MAKNLLEYPLMVEWEGNYTDLKAKEGYFSEDTYGDPTKVWPGRVMSQNVIGDESEQVLCKPGPALRIAYHVHSAIQNQIDKTVTAALRTREKIKEVYSAAPDTRYQGQIHTCSPAPGFRIPTIVFMHTKQATSPDKTIPQA